MNDMTAADAIQVRRMVPRIRRMLAESPGGVARAALRRRISSREKHLYDAALDLLIAVGDVVAEPFPTRAGTRYRLTGSEEQGEGRPSDQETSTNNDSEGVTS